MGDDKEHYLFYKEDTDVVELDLTGAARPLRLVAVDTRKPYEEIELGRYAPGHHRWKAPYRSDWTLAAGAFDRDAGSESSIDATTRALSDVHAPAR